MQMRNTALYSGLAVKNLTQETPQKTTSKCVFLVFYFFMFSRVMISIKTI